MKTPDRAERIKIFLHNWLLPGLCGLKLSEWLRLLKKHRFAIDVQYIPRALLITLLSVLNSLLSAYEDLRYGAQIRKTKVRQPLFLLGHWRSGTTVLNRYIAVDKRFAYPNAWQVVNPHTFLTTEPISHALLNMVLTKTRGIDNVQPRADAPFEDDPVAISCLRSYSLSFSFPRSAEEYEQYLTFDHQPAQAAAEWKSAMLRFYQKLTWKYGRPLVIKTPMHTGRIKQLLELFPDARFVHIYRNPYAVFKSTQQLVSYGVPERRLQRPPERDIDQHVIDTYNRMFDAFFAEKDLIPQGQLYELRYEDMEQDPVGEVAKIYQALGLPDFAEVRPALQQYVDGLASYRKNAHPNIPPTLRQRVSQAWKRNFEVWGYSYED